MAKVNVKLNQVDVEKEKEFRKTIIGFLNPGLRHIDFEKYYKAKKVLSFNKSENPKSVSDIFEQMSTSIILNIGTALEMLSRAGMPLDKISKLTWDSQLLNKVWGVIFNQNPNYVINGLKACVWLESVDTQILNGSIDAKDCGILISELRGIEEKLIEKKIDEKLLTAWSVMMTGLEVILDEFLSYHIELTKRQIKNQKNFIEKFCSSIGYYKWWILGYTALAGSVYLGLSAFGVPVAGEVFTPADAIKATVVDASMYTTAMGVAGAVLL